MTNQPHREFIYRMAYQLGRHIIGYEVQKVLSLVDWMSLSEIPIGVIGYGEGGLVAFHSAAVDARIQATAVSGYFQSRQEVWREPIYRNVWGLLHEFGDAESREPHRTTSVGLLKRVVDLKSPDRHHNRDGRGGCCTRTARVTPTRFCGIRI